MPQSWLHQQSDLGVRTTDFGVNKVVPNAEACKFALKTETHHAHGRFGPAIQAAALHYAPGRHTAVGHENAGAVCAELREAGMVDVQWAEEVGSKLILPSLGQESQSWLGPWDLRFETHVVSSSTSVQVQPMSFITMPVL